MKGGGIVSRYYDQLPPILSDGESLLRGGPFPTLKVAMSRARPDLFYAHLLRKCLERGIFTTEGRRYPTPREVAAWCDYGPEAFKAWLRPVTSKCRRKMPRRSISLVIHEYKLRDKSKYNWDLMLRYCD